MSSVYSNNYYDNSDVSPVFRQTATLACLDRVLDATVSPPDIANSEKKYISFDASVSAAFDQESCRDYLPYDVLIRCVDGECLAHRFVLVLQCEFFQARFRYDTCNSKLDDKIHHQASALSEVDFSSNDLATVDTIRLILQCLYKGQTSIESFESIRLDQVFNLLYMSNFLLLPCITDFCVRLLDGQLAKQDANFVMHVYHVAEELEEKTLSALAVKHIMLFEKEPSSLEAVSFDTMQQLLSSPESFNFQNLRSVCRMPALQRERYLLDLVVRFIKHNRTTRVRLAASLFAKLKLPYVVRDLDWDELDLPELKKDDAMKRLLVEASTAADSENLWQSGVSQSAWLPRPGSVKYSFYSKRFGSFKYRRPKNSNKLQQYKVRRVNFEREQEHRITGITVYPYTWQQGGDPIIGGIKLRWSDGTEDQAGHIDETVREEAFLRPYEAVLPRVSAGDFIHKMTFTSCKRSTVLSGQQNVIKVPPKTYGPFGREPAHCSRQRDNSESALGTFGNYDEICYLDGLKCCELIDSEGNRAITSVKFKISLLVNLPLEHLIPKKKVKGESVVQHPVQQYQPSWGLSYLENPKVLQLTVLKRALRMVRAVGYGNLGKVPIVPDN